jgi:hypothetical protein
MRAATTVAVTLYALVACSTANAQFAGSAFPPDGDVSSLAAAPVCTAASPVEARRDGTRAIQLPCSDATGIQVTDQPSSGTVSQIQNPFTGDVMVQYTPTPGQEQADTFTYVATNGAGQSDPVTQNVTVSSTANAAPICLPGATAVRLGASRSISLRCGDLDLDTVTIHLGTTAPSRGTLSTIVQPGSFASPGLVTYTPGPETGDDSFTIYASDATADGESATIDVTINAADFNTDPVCSPSSHTAASGALTPLLMSCSDADGDPLQYVVDTQPANGVASTFNVSGITGITYTSSPGFTGSDQLTFHATDDRGGSSAPAIATLTVTAATGSPPTCATPASRPVRTGGSKFFTLNCASLSGGTVSYTITDPPDHGTLTPVTGPSGAVWQYTHDGGSATEDSFSYIASNMFGFANAPVTQEIDISPTANEPPDCIGVGFTPRNARVNATRTIRLECYDPDQDTLTYAKNSDPLSGTLGAITQPTSAGSPGRIEYTAPATTGSDSFSINVSDGHGGTTNNVLVPVTIVDSTFNTAPTCHGATLSAPHNATFVVTLVSACRDDEGDPLTYNAIAGPSSTISVEPDANGDPRFTFEPNEGFSGTTGFQYTASDGSLTSLPQVVFVNVASDTGNQAPVCTNSAFETSVNTPVSLSGSGCNDPDGDEFSVHPVTSPTNGTLSVGGDGTVVYTPDEGFVGTDTFTYKAIDEQGLESNVATITITVSEDEPPNQAPTCSDVGLTTAKNTSLPLGSTVPCSDPDGDPLTASIVDPPEHGDVVENGDGTRTYVPDTGFSGTDAFTFKVNDGELDSNVATLTITVTNAAPVCQNKSVDVDHNTAKTFTLVCTDANGDALDLSTVAGPAKGSLSAINDTTGEATYTPNDGATGGDTLTFKANDGAADSNTATVTLTIADRPNAAPECEDRAVNVQQGETSTIHLACSDADGDVLVLTQSSPPSHGSLGPFDPLTSSVAYTPANGYFGSDSFSYRAFDGRVFSQAKTVTVNVVRSVTTENVPAGGGTVSTGPAASESTPVVTGITLPASTGGGLVTIAETPVVDTPPSGFTFVGQQVNITAPPASGPTDPLRLVFEVAASALPAGTTASNLEVFRNGEAAPACTGPAGHAVPNPCVALRETLGNGNVRITVLTVAASRWNFGKANPVSEPDPDPDPDPGTTTPRDEQPTGGGGATTGGGGAQPITPADTRAPAGSLSLGAKQTIRTLLAKGLQLTVKCDEACTADVELLIDAKTAKKLKLKTKIGSAKVTVPAGGSKKVAVKLSSAAKKKLKKLKSLKVTVKATAVDGSGNRAAARGGKTLTLKR